MANSYNPQGQVEAWFIDSVEGITNPAAPTAGEVNAGIALGMATRTITTPAYQGASIDATPIGAKAPQSLDGLPTITNAALVLLAGDTADAATVELFHDLKDLEKATGWLVLAPRGRVGRTDDEDGLVTVGDVVHVFPSRVNTVSLADSPGGQPATFRIDFTHSGTFHEYVEIVAS